MNRCLTNLALLCVATIATGCATTHVYNRPASEITAALQSLGAEDYEITPDRMVLIERMPAMGMRNEYKYTVSPIDAQRTKLSIDFSSRPDPIWLSPLAVLDPGDIFFSRSAVAEQRHREIRCLLEKEADVEQSPPADVEDAAAEE